MTRIGIGLCAVAVLALAGCGKSHRAEQGETVVHGANGDVALNKGKAPTNLPAYAPVYPGAEWGDTVTTTARSGSGGIAVFVTRDKPEEVIAFYEKAAAGKGLTNKSEIPADNSGSRMVMLGQPGSQRALTVAAGPNDNGKPGTKVSLSYGPA